MINDSDAPFSNHSIIFNFYSFIEVYLIYSVSSIQQSDSVIRMYVSFFRFFSSIGYYKTLNSVCYTADSCSFFFFFLVRFIYSSVYMSIPNSIVLFIERLLYVGAVLSGDHAFLPQQHQEIGDVTIPISKMKKVKPKGLMNGAVSHI